MVAEHRNARRWRAIGFYAAVGLGLLLVAFGLGELLFLGFAGWLGADVLDDLYPGASIHRVHILGHAIVAWMLALCLLAQAVRPRTSFATSVLALAIIVIYTAASLVSGVFSGLELVGIAALAAMVWLHPTRRATALLPVRPASLLLAAPLAVGAAIYAATQIGTQLAASSSEPHAMFGHYGIMGGLAAMVAIGALLGSSSLGGAPVSGLLAAGGALAFGVASIVFPSSASSLGMALGFGVAAAALATAAGTVVARHDLEAPMKMARHGQQSG